MSSFLLLCVLVGVFFVLGGAAKERWSAQKAVFWQSRHGYKAGFNFVPSTAVNELEMFQAATYDPITIDRELSWAQAVGFNTIRVFLHNILWEEGSDDFIKRLDDFLTITDKYKIQVTFVLLDSCWNGYPKAGTQPEPIPGVHNSQWVQCPGYDLVHNTTDFEGRVKPYVQGVVSAFRDDNRVLAWDVWNEPNNSGYSDDLIAPLIKMTFDWVREADPNQPLTTPVWQDTDGATYTTFQLLQLDLSDVLSFHNYDTPEHMVGSINRLREYDAIRPIVCTEYMARTAGSHFEPHLQIMKDANVYAYNWGFVSGRTQTIYPWTTSTVPATEEPAIWFHDVYRANGTAFNASEIAYIQSILLPTQKL